METFGVTGLTAQQTGADNVQFVEGQWIPGIVPTVLLHIALFITRYCRLRLYIYFLGHIYFQGYFSGTGVFVWPHDILEKNEVTLSDIGNINQYHGCMGVVEYWWPQVMYSVMSHTELIITVFLCMVSKWQASQIHLHITFGGDASIWTCFVSPYRSIVQYHVNLCYWDYFQKIMDKNALQIFCTQKWHLECFQKTTIL